MRPSSPPVGGNGKAEANESEAFARCETAMKCSAGSHGAADNPTGDRRQPHPG